MFCLFNIDTQNSIGEFNSLSLVKLTLIVRAGVKKAKADLGLELCPKPLFSSFSSTDELTIEASIDPDPPLRELLVIVIPSPPPPPPPSRMISLVRPPPWPSIVYSIVFTVRVVVISISTSSCKNVIRC